MRRADVIAAAFASANCASDGRVCGVRIIKEEPGRVVLVISFENGTRAAMRAMAAHRAQDRLEEVGPMGIAFVVEAEVLP
jgi:hypothetical protein